MPAPGPPLPPLPLGWGEHSPYPSMTPATHNRRHSGGQVPPPLPPMPPGALEKERRERFERERNDRARMVAPQPHRPLVQSMSNMSLGPGHLYPHAPPVIHPPPQHQQWSTTTYPPYDRAPPMDLPPRSASAAPTIDIGPPRPYSAAVRPESNAHLRSQTPLGVPNHSQQVSMHEFADVSRRPSTATMSSSVPPPLSHPWPDLAALAVARERSFASGDEKRKVAWAKQVLRYVERKQSGGTCSTVSDPALVRWIDESITIIQYNSNSSPPDVEALYLRGDLLSSGAFPTYVRKDLKAAFSDFERSARMGWAPSWFRVGREYESLGGNFIADAKQAYERGVAAADVGSLYRLGMANLLGQLGLPVNHAAAIPLLRSAADRCDLDIPQPAYIYGMLLSGEFSHVEVAANLLTPIPDPADPHKRLTVVSEARLRIERAAYLNFAPAQLKCGWLYEYAQLGCPFDPLLSVQYYTLASEGGEIEADMSLSKWFLCGAEGCFEKNERLAFSLAEKAARKGLATAEFALAYYHEVGVGVPKNIDLSKRWYRKAAAQGNNDAIQRLKELDGPDPTTLSRSDHQAHLDDKLQRTRTQAKLRSEKEGRGSTTSAPGAAEGASQQVTASASKDLARRQTMRMVERVAGQSNANGEPASARAQRVRPSEVAADVVARPSNSANAPHPQARLPPAQVQSVQHGQGYPLSDSLLNQRPPPAQGAHPPASTQSTRPPSGHGLTNGSQKFSTFAEMGFQPQKTGDGKDCVIC